MSRQIPILPIFAMLSIGAIGFWLYQNISFRDEVFEVDQSTEAKRNPVFAASLLLEENGFDFEVAKDRRVFSELKGDSTGVLWITDLHQLENIREAEQIMEWVQDGGILLASSGDTYAFSSASITSWLMEQIGVSPFEEDESPEPEYDDDLVVNSITLPDAGLKGQTFDIYSYYEPYFKINTDGPDNARTIIDTSQLIYRAIGDGYVALYADEEMFDSDRIDDFDQGYVLLWLTQAAKSDNVAIVVRPDSTPGLFTVLWSKYTLAICLFGIVLVGYLRWASSRLGPIEHELPPIKNNIMAHLEARGEFWYRHKYTDEVLAEVQAAAREHLSGAGSRLSSDNTLDPEERTAIIIAEAKPSQTIQT